MTTAEPYLGWTTQHFHAVDPAAYLGRWEERSAARARAYCGAVVRVRREFPAEVPAHKITCGRCSARYAKDHQEVSA